MPDRPHAADAIVSVRGEDPRSTADGPGIYYLDVLVHRATLGEPGSRRSSTVPSASPQPAILPPGGTSAT